MIEFEAQVLYLEAPCGLALASLDESQWLTLDASAADAPQNETDPTTCIYSSFNDEANGSYGHLTRCSMAAGLLTLERERCGDCPAITLQIRLSLSSENESELRQRLRLVFATCPDRLRLE